MKLTINSKNYQVKFGFGATRRIVEFYGYKNPSDYAKLVKKFKLDKLDNPSFAQLGFLGELFKSAVLNAHADDVNVNEDSFNSDDVMDAVMINPDTLSALILEFQNSQVQTDVNPDNRGK